MTSARILLAALLVGSSTPALALEVIPVPFVAADPTVPHLAYGGHATTFKAIARGGNGTYLFEWDFDGDGVYDFSTITTNRYDLSTRYTYPPVSVDTVFQAVIRVTSGGQVAVGTYPVQVLAGVPADPAVATDWQLQVLRGVAIDDGLWFLHQQLGRAGNESDPLLGAQVTGWLDSEAGGGNRTLVSASFLEALGRNGHTPAFPAAYLGEQPDPAANAVRWATDPYAEDAARLVNYLLTQATVVSVNAADESNLTGFYPEVAATRLAGTTDGIGILLGNGPGDLTNGPHSGLLRALSFAGLTGYVAQVGDPNRILGRRFEFLAQQLVDALVWSQNDGGTTPGSWYYTPNANTDLLGEYPAGTMDAVEALQQVERSLGPAGVVVPNLVKARLASYIALDARACPAGGLGGVRFYGPSYTACDFDVSAAHLVTWGWLGANGFAAGDTRLAFPGYSGLTRGQLRTQIDGNLTFIGATFNAITPGSLSWDMGFVEGANFARVDGRGDHWAMLHWTRAARAVSPPITRFGGNDHARLFSRYLIGNQATTGGWNWVLSSVLGSYNDSAVGSRGRAAWALLTLSTLSGDGQEPIAAFTTSALPALEGTVITFNGGAATGSPATYAWDLGNGQAREGRTITYAYPDNGTFDVTLTVTSPAGTSATTRQVVVQNAPPTVSAGANLTVAEGSPVAFAGSFTDPGTADTHTVSWDFGDGQGASTLAASHAYGKEGVYTATLTVTDDDDGIGSANLTVTVLNVAPTITSTPVTTATEGTAYGYTLAFTDPGTADVHACTAPVKPAGATLTGCTLSWTPTYLQAAAPSPVRLCVADDGGGSACQAFEVAVTALDADGLPDGWELAFFGSTATQTAASDSDHDGLTDGAEYLAGSDPTRWDGPGAPVLLAPACGSRMATATPTLLVANAIDAAGRTLTYEFELHRDAAMTNVVAAGRTVAAGPGYTSWTPATPLEEDGHYYWRARASTGAVLGAWTAPACELIVDAVAAVAPSSNSGGCSSAPGGAAGGSAPSLLVGVALALALRRRRRPA